MFKRISKTIGLVLLLHKLLLLPNNSFCYIAQIEGEFCVGKEINVSKLSGQVVFKSQEIEELLNGATVELFDKRNVLIARMTTNKQGKFSFGGWNDGEYLLTVYYKVDGHTLFAPISAPVKLRKTSDKKKLCTIFVILATDFNKECNGGNIEVKEE